MVFIFLQTQIARVYIFLFVSYLFSNSIDFNKIVLCQHVFLSLNTKTKLYNYDVLTISIYMNNERTIFRSDIKVTALVYYQII